MYVFINLYMYVFIYLLFIFDMQIYLFLSYWFVSTYCMNYIHIHVCACARAHLDTPRREKMKWDEMSRHMWLPCIQHDLANLPGHVPPLGLGPLGTFGAGNAARGGESLSVGSRFLASWHLVLLWITWMSVNAVMPNSAIWWSRMISYDRFCILVCFLHRDCTLWPAARGRVVQPTKRRRRRQCLPPCVAKTFQRLPT